MNQSINIKAHITDILQTGRFGVLATEGNGQPHASLIAYTPIEGFKSLIFATYRNTGKYLNIIQNRKVAVLIIGKTVKQSALQGGVITAFGHVEEISIAWNNVARREHLNRHPDMKAFMQSTDCALLRLTVEAYQVVDGIDDTRWYSIQKLEAYENLAGTDL